MKIRKKKRNKGGEKNKRLFLAGTALLFTGAGLLILSACLPGFARWYSRNIYTVLVSAVGRFWGIFPFSAAEFCIYALIVVFAGSGVYTIVNCIRRKNAGGRLKKWLSQVVFGAGILFFLYTAGCGINYYRKPFSEEENIQLHSYSSDELKEICAWFTKEVNARSGIVERNKKGVMESDGQEQEGAVEAMHTLGRQFASLKGYYPIPKKLTFPTVLSIQGLTGIYLPFTMEANYNGDLTAYERLFTMCHELSHLRGFMEEKEANFIGFLACISSERVDFQYSGYLSGWVYCMNELYRADYEKWAEVRNQLNEKTEYDLKAQSDFWEKYEGPVQETARRINDTYLKANGQAEGVEGYDRMVDLIAAYYAEK